MRNHYFALFLFSLNHAKILDPGMFQILIKCKIENINVILGKKWEKFPLNLGGGHEGKLRTFDPLISALFRPAGAESEKVTSFCLKRIKNKNIKNNGQIVKCKIPEQGGKKVSFDL